jgi:hypothetical protein
MEFAALILRTVLLIRSITRLLCHSLSFKYVQLRISNHQSWPRQSRSRLFFLLSFPQLSSRYQRQHHSHSLVLPADFLPALGPASTYINLFLSYGYIFSLSCIELLYVSIIPASCFGLHPRLPAFTFHFSLFLANN